MARAENRPPSPPMARVVRGTAIAKVLASTPLLAAVATVLALFLVFPAVTAVWSEGRYFDTDDAMRMVQVRDLLAGQGWYDLVAHRLAPPDGMLSHWSRIVDVPLAGLILMFSWFTSREQAETLTRLAFPLLLHFAYFAALFALVRRLVGDSGVLVAFGLAVLCGTTNIQFLPGRIDHHAPQIVLLMLMALMSVRMLLREDRRAAWLLGALIALSFAISIENMPFIAALLAVIAFAWASGHAPIRTALVPLGLSLVIAAPLAFALTVPLARALDPIADAYGIAHVALLVGGGAAALAAGVATVTSSRLRWALLAGAGVVCLALVATVFPYLLRDPLVTVDPLVRQLWLARVTEARPALRVLLASPDIIVQHLGPLLCGAVAVVIAAIAHRRDDKRWPWIAIATLIGIGTLGAFWQIRVLASVLPFALVAGAFAIIAVHDRLTRDGGSLVLVKTLLVALLFCVQVWDAFIHSVSTPDTAVAEHRKQASACFESASFAPLAHLPRQTALSMIDLGPYMLALTPHAAIAASYHRNNRGNHLLIDAMTADPAKARALIEGSGAKLLVLCPAGREFEGYLAAAPQGFAAMLRDAAATDFKTGLPPWLTLVGDPAGPIKILAIR